MTKTIIALALFAFPASADAQTIQGRWKLLAAEDMRADGSVARLPWGKNPVGAIVVQGGHCYVQIMSSDVPSFTAATPSVSEQMSAALLSTYIAYSGPCTIDEAAGKVMDEQMSHPFDLLLGRRWTGVVLGTLGDRRCETTFSGSVLQALDADAYRESRVDIDRFAVS